MFRPALPARPAVRRRTVVAAAAAAVALSACEPLGGTDGDTPDAVPPPGDDPDQGALTEALETIDGAAALVTAASTAGPALAGRLAGLSALHAAHRGALIGAGGSAASSPSPTTPSPSTTAPSAAAGRPPGLAQVRTAERHLADRLARLALAAESGAFARLLAVMSAAVRQQLAVLDGTAAP